MAQDAITKKSTFLISRRKAQKVTVRVTTAWNYRWKMKRKKFHQLVKADASLPVTADASLPVRADASLQVRADASLPVTADASLPVKADASFPVKADASLPVRTPHIVFLIAAMM